MLLKSRTNTAEVCFERLLDGRGGENTDRPRREDPPCRLNHPTLTLGATRAPPQEARRWVASVCRDLGRMTSLECAELGVSELVTNALAPRGRADPGPGPRHRDHPRIEVGDGSPHPPCSPTTSTTSDELMLTFGRGLSIVARCSVAWGAAIEPDGKVVWFEPAEVPHQEAGTPRARSSTCPGPAGRQRRESGPRRADCRARRAGRADVRPAPALPTSCAARCDCFPWPTRTTYPLARDLTDVFSAFDRAYPPAGPEQVDHARSPRGGPPSTSRSAWTPRA